MDLGCVSTEIQFHEINLIFEYHDFTLRALKKNRQALDLNTLGQWHGHVFKRRPISALCI